VQCWQRKAAIVLLKQKFKIMKKIIFFLSSLTLLNMASAQNKTNLVSINFQNDYEDVYHLSLIVYTPDGKSQTRVSEVPPKTTKAYEFPAGTEIFIADWKQEAYAMKGNDIKTTNARPYIILQNTDDKKVIKLSGVSVQRNFKETIAVKPDANEALGTWVIDLRPTADAAAYLKDFKFTKIDGKQFDGEFYGYPFSGGFLNTSWDKIYFAFTTTDQTSTYFHSGYIEGDTIFGITLNETRKFVLPWKGKKK
jgi:hypothetical protein